MTLRAGSKDLRALARELVAGVGFAPHGKSKLRLVDRDGETIRYPDGRPVSFPNSPTELSLRNLEHRLRGLGLLREKR